ncbi:TetR/AcrR family transcriptional regulator [Streptosporangium sp. NPDC048047]|uniref:TetR/AcrR family transcriptional regulator n=1 Tax=Streptosporangium sp. NPDC048047 TaxID=3155748 RepID=UPI003435E46E
MTKAPPDASHEKNAGLPGGLRRAWGVADPAPRRGPKASLSIPMILDAAVSLADAEGLQGLSLVRIAEQLGVTTNALYRYLDSREELDLLLRDHALGAPERTERTFDRWQDAVAEWARSLRARYVRHPWLADLSVRVPVTPHALAWLEILLERLGGSGLDDVGTLRAAGLLDGYVRWSSAAARDLAGNRTPVVEGSAIIDLVGPLLVERGMPRIAALFDGGLYRESPERHEDADFEFGVGCILAGLTASSAT